MNSILLAQVIPDVAIYALVAIVALALLLLGSLALASRFYQKVGPDEAIVRTGWGGMQVVTANGVFVLPVIHHADQLNLLQLSEAIGTLSRKARANQLTLDDVQGGTFTLTSIGSIGGIFSAPIVNVPEVAIMGIQKIEPRPVVVDNEIVIRDRSYLSISCDHRVVDGAEAALFMKAVVEILEHPARMLLGC